jgi:hypothetical protein
MSFAMLMVVAAVFLVLRPARSCEIATADVFCERYRRRRGIELKGLTAELNVAPV